MYTLLLTLAPLGAAPARPALPVAEETTGALVLELLRSPAGPGSANPTLTHGANGEVYLTWFERTGRHGGAIRFSVLEERGWAESVVITRGPELRRGWADSPAVAALENGTLLATWLRDGKGPHGFNTEFAVSSDRGRTWTPPRPLHSDLSPAEHGFASVVPMHAGGKADGKAGGFGAIWLDGREAGATGLYFRTISASGELGEETLLDPRVCSCCQTSLATTQGGGLLAIYRDRSSQEIRDISFVRFDGEKWSEPETLHEDGWLIAGCPINGPRAAADASTTAAAWFTGVGDGGGSVRVAFQKSGAARFGFPTDVDEGQPIGRVDVVSTGDGSALVSWLEYAGEGGAEWRLRQVWRDGRRGDSLAIEQVPFDRASGYLRMVATGEEALLAWTAAGTDRRVGTARVRTRK